MFHGGLFIKFVTMIIDDEVIKDGYGDILVLDKDVETGEKPPSK
jgi:hypothetical protein